MYRHRRTAHITAVVNNDNNSEQNRESPLLRSPSAVVGLVAAYAMMYKTYIVDISSRVLQDISQRARDILHERQHKARTSFASERFYSLQSELVDARRSLGELENYLEAAEERFQKATNVLLSNDVTKEQVDSACARANEQQNALQQTRGELEEFEASLNFDVLAQEVKNLSAQADDKMEEVQSAQRRLKDLNEHFEQVNVKNQDESQETEKEVVQLESILSQKRASMSSLIEQRGFCAEAVEDLQKRIRSCQEKLQDIVERTVNVRENLVNDLGSPEAESRDPTEKISRMTDELESCLKEIERRRTQRQDGQVDNEELVTLRNQLSESDAVVAGLQRQIEEVQDDVRKSSNRSAQPSSYEVANSEGGSDLVESLPADVATSSESKLREIRKQFSVAKKSHMETLAEARRNIDQNAQDSAARNAMSAKSDGMSDSANRTACSEKQVSARSQTESPEEHPVESLDHRVLSQTQKKDRSPSAAVAPKSKQVDETRRKKRSKRARSAE